MRELELGPKDIASLQKMDWAKLFAAGNAAAAKINGPVRGPTGLGFPAGGPPRVGWSPTVDGKIITLRSYQDAAPDVSRNVPVLIGSVSEEGMGYGSNPTEDQWRENLTKSFGADKAVALIAAMKRAHPEKSIRTL